MPKIKPLPASLFKALATKDTDTQYRLDRSDESGYQVRLVTPWLDAVVTYDGPHDGSVPGGLLPEQESANPTLGETCATAPTELTALDPDQLQDTLEYLHPAASRDSTRPTLVAIHVRPDWWLSSDGHRMHLVGGMPAVPGLEILPLPYADAILRSIKATHAESVEIHVNRHLAGHTLLWTRVKGASASVCLQVVFGSPGEVPAFEQVLPPANYGTCYSADSARLTKVLETAPVWVLEKAKCFTLRCGPEIVAQPQDRTMPDAVLPISTPVPGPEVTFAVNPKYLLEALDGLCGPMTLNLADEFSPMVLSDEHRRMAVVMPMRA